MTTQFQSSRSAGLTECITLQTVLVNGLVTLPVVSTMLTMYAKYLKQKNMDEALSGPHVMEWKEAAELEYQSLMENDTRDLVELP